MSKSESLNMLKLCKRVYWDACSSRMILTGYNRWKSENPDIKFRVIRGVGLRYEGDAGYLS